MMMIIPNQQYELGKERDRDILEDAGITRRNYLAETRGEFQATPTNATNDGGRQVLASSQIGGVK